MDWMAPRTLPLESDQLASFVPGSSDVDYVPPIPTVSDIIWANG
jgi:hypothetical protein